MKQKIRTFVAVEIDPAVREMAAELIAELSTAGANVKWVDAQNMHITVKFLGEVDTREVHEVCRAVETAVAPLAPFVLEVRGAGAFPNVRRPRTLWLGTRQGSEPFVELAERVDKQLHRLGYPREGRRFHAHLTLGRVRQGEAGLARLAELLAERADFEAGRSDVSEAVIFSSDLDRGGPTYEPLGHAALGGG
jgi:2'-5' RNA ligase